MLPRFSFPLFEFPPIYRHNISRVRLLWSGRNSRFHRRTQTIYTPIRPLFPSFCGHSSVVQSVNLPETDRSFGPFHRTIMPVKPFISCKERVYMQEYEAQCSIFFSVHNTIAWRRLHESGMQTVPDDARRKRAFCHKTNHTTDLDLSERKLIFVISLNRHAYETTQNCHFRPFHRSFFHSIVCGL